MLNHHFLALLVTSITHSILSLFVYLNGRKKLTNITYSLYSASIAFWSGFEAFSITSKNPHDALVLWRLNHIGVIFIPIFFVHFVVSLLPQAKQAQKKILIRASYLVGLGYLFVDLKGWLILEVVPKFYFRYFINPGHTYKLFFSLWVFWALFGLFELCKLFFNSPPDRKNQLSYFSISMFIAYLGGVPNFLPTFNVEIPILIPFGTYAISVYAFITTYAIITRNLMDIEVIIRRTAVFAGLFAFVYGVFTIFTILGQEFFKNSLHWNQWIATIPTVLIITFTLRPLENFLTNTTERWLFQKKYDYRELLRTFTNETLTVLDLGKLTMQTVESLVKIVKLESAAILLHDKDAKVYKMVAGMGIKEKEIIFKDGDLLIDYLKKTNQHILKDKSVDKIEGEGELKENFKRLNARLCLPIEFHDNLIGILCLGMKKSGEDFTQEDIDILNTLATTEAIAISNATQFDENAKMQAVAAQSEKMAVIGTLAAGINHEICNPLGIVRGQCEMFLLNSRDGFYNEKSSEELLKISSEIMGKVISQTDRATAITKKLSSFAKPSKRNELEEVRVEKEVEEVLGLIEHDLRLNNIDIQKDFPNNFPVILADKKQIQEVFFNIIRNAAQAMDKKQGKILVSGFVENGTAVIRIADNGSGIPADKMNQVFNPFYTTKAPGKGTGLGLIIVKQVVKKNQGTIALESEIGVGTTFTLRFPIAVTLVAA